MDVSTLATGLTAVLAPALPYRVTVGEKAVEAVGERLGGGAWDRARTGWEWLRGPVEQDLLAAAQVDTLTGRRRRYPFRRICAGRIV